jgi:hypothetical protein
MHGSLLRLRLGFLGDLAAHDLTVEREHLQDDVEGLAILVLGYQPKVAPTGGTGDASGHVRVRSQLAATWSGNSATSPSSRKEDQVGERRPLVFMTERAAPITTGGSRKTIVRTGESGKFPLPVHPHMLRHACGYKHANDSTRAQYSTISGIGTFSTRCNTRSCRPSDSKVFGRTEVGGPTLLLSSTRAIFFALSWHAASTEAIAMAKDFQLIHVTVDEGQLNAASNRLRNQFVGCMHAHNELAILNRAMSRFLLNIEKRPLSWFTLSGVGLASKNAI